jgi:hypothetical protein
VNFSRAGADWNRMLQQNSLEVEISRHLSVDDLAMTWFRTVAYFVRTTLSDRGPKTSPGSKSLFLLILAWEPPVTVYESSSIGLCVLFFLTGPLLTFRTS